MYCINTVITLSISVCVYPTEQEFNFTVYEWCFGIADTIQGKCLFQVDLLHELDSYRTFGVELPPMGQYKDGLRAS